MANRLLKSRIKASEAQVKSFVLQLERFIERELGTILADVKAGKVEAKEAARLLGKLFSELEKAGLKDEVARAKSLYSEALDNVKDDFIDLGVKNPFTDADQATVNALVNADLSRVPARVQQYTTDIRASMMRSILGGEQVSFAALHATLGGKMAGWLETELNTSLQAFSRTMTANKAEELGFELFIYLGPDDGITRPFCERCLDGRAPGVAARKAPIYTRAEISRMRNGQDLDVMVFGGGYNCRHQWRPISEEDAKAQGFEKKRKE